MTVAALPAVADYLEDGVTTVFPVPYRFKAAGDLVVERLLNGDVLPLDLGVDYTVAGGRTDAGGTVTRTVATNGATLRIRRRTARAQPMTYTTGDRFPATSHEEALDRNILIAQEQDAQLDDLDMRALKVPVGDVGAGILPSALARAGRMLGFDATGKAMALTSSALALSLGPLLPAILGPSYKGDPGGNVMAVGLFTAIHQMVIPAGADAIQTSGHSVRGRGIASYVAVEDTGQPESAFRKRDARGRLWELYTGDVPVNAADFGGVFDGASHPLSTRYPTLEAARAVYPHAFALTDEIDWAALQSAMDYARIKGRTVGFAGHAIVNRPLVICGYPQTPNGAYDPSLGYPLRDLQIGGFIGLGGGGSGGATTGKRAVVEFTHGGLVADQWPSSSASKSAYDPAFGLKVGFIATRTSSTSELGGWTMCKMEGLEVIGPVNGVGMLDANGSNKVIRECRFAGGQRYGHVSCNNRSTSWKKNSFQAHKRAGIGLLYLSDRVNEILNTGGFFNDGLQIEDCTFSSGTRFADIEDHGSQSEGIRLIKGCSHTNGAVYGYIGRKNVQPVMLNNWYENVQNSICVLGTSNEILPGTTIFAGILPEENAGISTTQFPGGYAFGLTVQGCHFKPPSVHTGWSIRADNYGVAHIGANSVDDGNYILRTNALGGYIIDEGSTASGSDPDVYYSGPRQLYFGIGDKSSDRLGAPQGVNLPVSINRGVNASSLGGGAVVNPIQATGIVKAHSFQLAQTAGGTSVSFVGWHAGTWKLTATWGAHDGYPAASAEITLLIESSHSVGGSAERDRIWCEVQEFRMLGTRGSRGAAWSELPEISVWPRSAAQSRQEVGDTTPPHPHVDLTFRGLASGGARQIMVKAEFVGILDYDADIGIVAIPNPGNINSFGPTISRGSAAPVSGNWATGSIVWNEAPISGGVAFWECHTGGAPGTWQPVRLAAS